ncbi:hypothetical protein DL96DRAFT_1609227 [Flagelloscypha sp. PMI_526]|nr:hypothetical protein DL96DRAFT_1609227 [Flagelloscypha sp. PMI_526]
MNFKAIYGIWPPGIYLHHSKVHFSLSPNHRVPGQAILTLFIRIFGRSCPFFRIENVLYRNIVITSPSIAGSRPFLSSVTKWPGLFANKTESLWLIVRDRDDGPLALSALSALRNLRKAFIYIKSTFFEVLQCLLALPNLKEVRFHPTFNMISPVQSSTIQHLGNKANITHIILTSWEFEDHFFQLFPRLTHLAVIYYKLSQLDSIQMFCNVTPRSLHIFVLIDGWSSSWSSNKQIDDLTKLNAMTMDPSFIARRVLYPGREPVLWDKTPSIWSAVNKAISNAGAEAGAPSSSWILVQTE